MKVIKKIIIKILFGNKYTLKIRKIGKNSKIALYHNILNGKYIEIGNNTCIGRYSKIHCFDSNNGIKYKPNVKIGNDCLIGQNFSIICTNSIVIEDKVMMASYITIVDENHGMNVESDLEYRRQKLTTSPIIVKEGAWIGERVIILPGVTIGKKAVVGSGSIVNKSIPDYTIAVGNPAKVIKKWDFEKHEWVKI